MVVKIDNPAKGITGVRIDREVTNELENYYTCTDCGQSVDMRDLGQVFHHEESGHKPLTGNA